MPSIEHVVAQLNAFQPNLTPGHDSARLRKIVDGLRELPRRLEAVPAIFALIERFPNADLGSPGPLVHELESTGDYQQELRSSLRRLPTVLTLWIVNRILNSRRASEETFRLARRTSNLRVASTRVRHEQKGSLGVSRTPSVSRAWGMSTHKAVSPNPSIERTSSSQLRCLAAAAHVER